MPAKAIVITGSTKGIGYGLAEEFLKAGHHVVVSGRRRDTIDEAVAKLNSAKPSGRAVGIACDVADMAQVENLWRQTVKVFGRVDIWINNAGLINRYRHLIELDPARDIVTVIETNLSGAMNGTKGAAQGMARQDAVAGWRGAIYNFEGFGSDGMTRGGMAIYGATKRALTYFTGAAAKELKAKAILVGYIQPGIVVTELGLGDAWGLPADEVRKRKKIVMMFGDPVAPVARYIAAKVLGNAKTGVRINWMGLPKILWRLLTHKFLKRDPIGESGLA
ncbi:MAG: SDR family oxidoreductase [Rhodospirillaceae bacterium]|nr:SDR family oxidoreductase [Rhodospirillaceae bacterium]